MRSTNAAYRRVRRVDRAKKRAPLRQQQDPGLLFQFYWHWHLSPLAWNWTMSDPIKEFTRRLEVTYEVEIAAFRWLQAMLLKQKD